MNFAFCLFDYFPYGGLQRDLLQLITLCLQRGHQVDVYTMSWSGKPPPPGVKLVLLPKRGWRNHQRAKNYATALVEILKKSNYDQVIGFNKLPGLDVYYAADSSIQGKRQYKKFPWLKWFTRYRTYLSLEQEVFSVQADTQIFLLSEQERAFYKQAYHTQDHRFHILPPGIDRSFLPTTADEKLRKSWRQQHKIEERAWVFTAIASSFRTKGIDRVIRVFKRLPEPIQQQSTLLIVGADASPYCRFLARRHRERIRFLGAREDIRNILKASDLFLHFPRLENAGIVLLEALVSGLPIITTENCGYAEYVNIAGAGLVLPTSCAQTEISELIAQSLTPQQLQTWRTRGLRYAETADLYSLFNTTLQLLEANVNTRHLCA